MKLISVAHRPVPDLNGDKNTLVYALVENESYSQPRFSALVAIARLPVDNNSREYQAELQNAGEVIAVVGAKLEAAEAAAVFPSKKLGDFI